MSLNSRFEWRKPQSSMAECRVSCPHSAITSYQFFLNGRRLVWNPLVGGEVGLICASLWKRVPQMPCRKARYFKQPNRRRCPLISVAGCQPGTRGRRSGSRQWSERILRWMSALRLPLRQRGFLSGRARSPLSQVQITKVFRARAGCGTLWDIGRDLREWRFEACDSTAAAACAALGHGRGPQPRLRCRAAGPGHYSNRALRSRRRAGTREGPWQRAGDG